MFTHMFEAVFGIGRILLIALAVIAIFTVRLIAAALQATLVGLLVFLWLTVAQALKPSVAELIRLSLGLHDEKKPTPKKARTTAAKSSKKPAPKKANKPAIQPVPVPMRPARMDVWERRLTANKARHRALREAIQILHA